MGRLQVRVNEEDQEAWKAQAEVEGLDYGPWVRHALNTYLQAMKDMEPRLHRQIRKGSSGR